MNEKAVAYAAVKLAHRRARSHEPSNPRLREELNNNQRKAELQGGP